MRMDEWQINTAKALRACGMSYRDVGAAVGVSHTAIQYLERRGWANEGREASQPPRVLGAVNSAPGRTAAEIAAKLGLSAAHVTPVLRRLEAEGKVHGVPTSLPYKPLAWFPGRGECSVKRFVDHGPVVATVLEYLTQGPATIATLAGNAGCSRSTMGGVVMALIELGLLAKVPDGFELTMRGDLMRATLERREGAK